MESQPFERNSFRSNVRFGLVLHAVKLSFPIFNCEVIYPLPISPVTLWEEYMSVSGLIFSSTLSAKNSVSLLKSPLTSASTSGYGLPHDFHKKPFMSPFLTGNFGWWKKSSFCLRKLESVVEVSHMLYMSLS